MSTDFSPATIALLQRHVMATRQSLAAMAARQVPDPRLFAELDAVHAALRSLPLPERVRTMSVLTWACQMMGMSPVEVAPLLCDRLSVQMSDAYSVGLTASDTAKYRALAESLVQGRPIAPPVVPTAPTGSPELAEIAELGAAIIDALAGVEHAARLGNRKRKELEETAAGIKAWDEAKRYAAIELLARFLAESYAVQDAIPLAGSLLGVATPEQSQPTFRAQQDFDRMLAERYPIPPMDRVAACVRMAVGLSASERGSKGKPASPSPDLAVALGQLSRVERDFALVLAHAVHQRLQLKLSRHVPKPAKSADTWIPRRYPMELKQLTHQLADELRPYL